MFETSVVRAEAQAAGNRASLLTMSLLAHSAVVIGAIAFSIASVNFPTNAPDEYAMAPTFMPITVPPPLGNPNGGAPKPQQPRVEQPTPQPAPQPNQVTAPQEIPNDVPVLEAPLANGSGTNTDSTGTVPGPIGVPWGVKDSVGSLDAPPAPIASTPVEEKIYEAHEVKAPVLVRRIDPPYPPQLVKTRLRALVVVRCIIDKNGHVRDPQILKPDLPPFNAAVLNAVQQWRYTPGSRNGIAVETYLNVSVTFSVN